MNLENLVSRCIASHMAAGQEAIDDKNGKVAGVTDVTLDTSSKREKRAVFEEATASSFITIQTVLQFSYQVAV